MEPERQILSYASGTLERVGGSPYGVAAIVVLLLDFVWFWLPGPFDMYKHFHVFLAAWFLGLCLTIAAYSQRCRKLTLAHVGVVLLVTDFLLTAFLPTF